jgi:sugar phosphate isomerase/epimerase
VGAVLDTAHAFLHGLDLVEYYTHIRNFLIELHLHNNNGTSDQHLAISRGIIDYREFLSQITPGIPIIMEIRNQQEAIESLEWVKQFETH